MNKLFKLKIFTDQGNKRASQASSRTRIHTEAWTGSFDWPNWSSVWKGENVKIDGIWVPWSCGWRKDLIGVTKVLLKYAKAYFKQCSYMALNLPQHDFDKLPWHVASVHSPITALIFFASPHCDSGVALSTNSIIRWQRRLQDKSYYFAMSRILFVLQKPAMQISWFIFSFIQEWALYS